MKGFKKMGLMFLALVIALAGIGVGYAAWTDTLLISGTVNTGSVDLDIVAVSGTYVYKDLTVVDPGQYGTEIDVVYWQTDEGVLMPPTPDPDRLRVAWAYGMSPVLRPFGAPENYAVMVFKNLFPSIDFKADVKIHYAGTIPAKVNDITYAYETDDQDGDWIAALIASGDIVGTARLYDALDPNDPRIGDTVVKGYQLHYCDVIEIELSIHIPQDDVYEGRSATGTATIDVVQWNEYPYTAPTPN